MNIYSPLSKCHMLKHLLTCLKLVMRATSSLMCIVARMAQCVRTVVRTTDNLRRTSPQHAQNLILRVNSMHATMRASPQDTRPLRMNPSLRTTVHAAPQRT